MLVVFTKTLAAASAVNIAASQTPGGAVALTLVGGSPVTLDSQRRVLITSAGNISATTFTIVGTRDTGQIVTEVLAGPNAGTSQSIYDYRTITSITSSGASGSALTVGTSTVGSSDWKNPSTRANPFDLSINATVTGTVNYSLETTNSRMLVTSLFPTLAINPVATAVVNATANAVLTLTTPVRGWRLTILSGTGSVTVEASQTGY